MLVSAAAAAASLAVACGSNDNSFGTSSGGTSGAGGGGAGVSGTGGLAGSAGTGGMATGGAAGMDGGSDGSAGAGGAATGGSGGASAGGTGGASTGGSGGASTGGSGGTSAGGTGGIGGSCADNNDEPNESEKAATSIGAVSCGGSSKSHDGVAAMSADADWYKVTANGATLCSGDAVASVDQSNLRVCVFAKCASGTTSRTCKHGTATTSPDGLDGCCNTGGTAEAQTSCSGVLNDQAAELFIRVDQPSGNACTPYKLTYSY